MGMDYVLKYYQMGLCTDKRMEQYVSIGWITQEQYNSVKAA